MVERNASGQFEKGWKGGPGRPPRAKEEKFYRIMTTAVTLKDWREIIKKAVEQAKRGNHQARKFLADYLIGPPIERKEISGPEGAPITIVEVVKDDGE